MQALTMGGYGGYVWAAFGFTLISMIGLLWQSWRAQARGADELAILRSALRGGTRRRAEQADQERPRRLVATKPASAALARAVQPMATAAHDERPTQAPDPGRQGFAISRPSSGT